MLKGLKLSFKKKEDVVVPDAAEEALRSELDPMASQLVRRPPQMTTHVDIEDAPATDMCEADERINEGPKKRKYDFSKFEERRAEEDVQVKRLEPTVHALQATAEDAWTALKSLKFSVAQESIDKIDNSIYWWLHGGNSIFANSGQQGLTDSSNPLTGGKPDNMPLSDNMQNTVIGLNDKKVRDLQDYDKDINRLATGKKNMEDFVHDEYDNLHQAGDKMDTGRVHKKGYLKRVAERVIRKERKEEMILANCRFCLGNALLKEEEVLSISDNFFLVQPNKSNLLITSSISRQASDASSF